MSEHLTERGISHVILERNRIAERWRSERWDSLVANGPAWHDRFQTLEFSDVGPDEFPTKDEIASYFEQYAKKMNVPIRGGVEVTSVTKNEWTPGFHVDTTDSSLEARFIVAATGPFQKPNIPPIVPKQTNIRQLHSSSYRNPHHLPAGAVLVVGAGSSGVQIASEIQRSGRQVYLAVGPHDRPPRRYRGRDFVWCLGGLGQWDATRPSADAAQVTIAVSGADGGKTIDFRELEKDGIELLGRAVSFDNGLMHFSTDLGENIESGDRNYLSLLEEADRYVERNGLNLPEEPSAHVLGPRPQRVSNPITELDFSRSKLSTIIWATGFHVDFSWLKVNAFDESGRPKHQRGVSSEPGVYFLGLPWLSRRGSSFIWGTWHDAKYIADQIDIQYGYRRYSSDEG